LKRNENKYSVPKSIENFVAGAIAGANAVVVTYRIYQK